MVRGGCRGICLARQQLHGATFGEACPEAINALVFLVSNRNDGDALVHFMSKRLQSLGIIRNWEGRKLKSGFRYCFPLAAFGFFQTQA